MVGVTVFDGHLDVLLKRNRSFQVPAVKAISSTNLLRILNVGASDQRVGVRLNLSTGAPEVPRAIVIILSSSARDHGQCAVIDENHFVAFPEPVILILQHGLHYSDKVSSTLGFHKYVIVFAV